MVEAYIGALFIDSNFDYNEVQRFFDQHVKPYFDDMTIYDTFANNHPIVSEAVDVRMGFGVLTLTDSLAQCPQRAFRLRRFPITRK